MSTSGETLSAAIEPRHRALPDWAWGLALVLLVLVVFSPAIGHGVIWDDGEYVTENPDMDRWSGPGWFWLEPGRTIQWYPMTMTVLWAEHRLWGNWLPGFHAASVLLHGLNAVLVWRLMVRLKAPAAWAVATLFAVHPLCTETVGWMSEQKNLLALCFGIVTLLLSLRVAEGGDWNRMAGLYALSVLTFALCLTSKPALCGLPLITLVVLWMREKLTWRQTLFQMPHVALAVGMALMSSHVERTSAGSADPSLAFTWPQRVMIGGMDIAFYLSKFLVPWPLLGVYDRWDPAHPPMLAYVMPFVVAGGVVALWVLRKRIGRGPVAGTLVAILALGPMLGGVSFASMVWAFVADHYTYVALPAMVAVVVGPLSRVLPRRVGIGALGAAAAILSVISFAQSSLYRDGTRLWSYTIYYLPNSWVAQNNMANTLLVQGRGIEAVPYAARALELNPESDQARYHLAVALLAAGRLDEALGHTETLIARNPRWLDAGLLRSRILDQKRKASPRDERRPSH